VIANMGAELGATTTVFPSDARTQEFTSYEGRPDEWIPFSADADALELVDPDESGLEDGDVLVLGARERLASDDEVALVRTDGRPVRARHSLTQREIDFVLAGGRIPSFRRHA
jgi:hypothetical protein